MYEVLNQSLINPGAVEGESEGWHTTSETLMGYAKKVAEGYREPIPDRWPVSVMALLQQCWAYVSGGRDVFPPLMFRGCRFVCQLCFQIPDRWPVSVMALLQRCWAHVCGGETIPMN